MVKWSVEFKLPGLSIKADDINVSYRRDREVGPFVVIQRDCGMAIDTAFRTTPGERVLLWPPHGLNHQLWYLRPSGVPAEVLLVSAANGLVLDATADIGNDVHPVMSEARPQSDTQRWRLK